MLIYQHSFSFIKIITKKLKWCRSLLYMNYIESILVEYSNSQLILDIQRHITAVKKDKKKPLPSGSGFDWFLI